MKPLHLHPRALLLACLLCACDRPPDAPKAAEPEKPKTAEPAKPHPPELPAPPAAPAAQAPPADPARKILSVEEVRVEPVEGEPGKLTISVVGSVNSGGWSRPELRLRQPQLGDGTLAFDFFAEPPDSAQTFPPVLKKVYLTVTVDKAEGYREVKVVARTNSMTAK
jgi:hypothetical protein